MRSLKIMLLCCTALGGASAFAANLAIDDKASGASRPVAGAGAPAPVVDPSKYQKVLLALKGSKDALQKVNAEKADCQRALDAARGEAEALHVALEAARAEEDVLGGTFELLHSKLTDLGFTLPSLGDAEGAAPAFSARVVEFANVLIAKTTEAQEAHLRMITCMSQLGLLSAETVKAFSTSLSPEEELGLFHALPEEIAHVLSQERAAARATLAEKSEAQAALESYLAAAAAHDEEKAALEAQAADLAGANDEYEAMDADTKAALLAIVGVSEAGSTDDAVVMVRDLVSRKVEELASLQRSMAIADAELASVQAHSDALKEQIRAISLEKVEIEAANGRAEIAAQEALAREFAAHEELARLRAQLADNANVLLSSATNAVSAPSNAVFAPLAAVGGLIGRMDFPSSEAAPASESAEPALPASPHGRSVAGSEAADEAASTAAAPEVPTRSASVSAEAPAPAPEVDATASAPASPTAAPAPEVPAPASTAAAPKAAAAGAGASAVAPEVGAQQGGNRGRPDARGGRSGRGGRGGQTSWSLFSSSSQK